jgi:hypothetical protein
MTTENIVRKNIRRELPVPLTDLEFVELSRYKANLELEREEAESAFAERKNDHTQRLKDLDARIGKAGAELRVGEQKRVVECLQRYVKTGEHAGKVETVRLDTNEVVERHAADLLESRQAVPDDEVSDDMLEQAAKMQREGNVEENDEGDVTVPDSPAAKVKRRKGKAKR